MKTDSLFYTIFQELPFVFFAILSIPESVTTNYQFTSQEVKQLSQRLDGLFLPITDDPELPFYIVEVQFQSDLYFYDRLFNELFVYIRQYRPPHPWQLVIIYPDRQTERINELHFGELLQLPNITRIYINELHPSETTSLPIQLLQLIIEPEDTATDLAIDLANQARLEISNSDVQNNLINLLETIIVYKLPQKSREEIAAMFTRSDLKQTRFYQEVFAEGEAEGKAEAKQREKATILRMSSRGLSQAEIADLLDLPLTEVEAIVTQAAPEQN